MGLPFHSPRWGAGAGAGGGLRWGILTGVSHCQSALQVSYVLDTEDIFCRTQRRQRRADAAELEAKRKARFHLWLDTTDVAPRPVLLQPSERMASFA